MSRTNMLVRVMTELLRSRENILSDLVRSILANTDLDDISPNSSLSILLDALSGVMFQNQLLVLKILESTSLESINGIDLDRKAASLGLPDTVGGVGRRPSSPSSGRVTVFSSFTKLSSKLYAGKPAPFGGSSTIYVENASTWPNSGSVYIGRGTASNLEGPIPYTKPVDSDKGTYWQIDLGGVLTKNHALSETVIVAQGGDRSVKAGTVVSTTANSNSPAIQFTTDFDLLIPDGEDSGEVTVTAGAFGDQSNALSGSVNTFISLPFSGAGVKNTTSFANGRSTETDEELRQRIRDYPATLARGTKNAIIAALLGLRDPVTGKAIASVVVIEPTTVGEPSRVYINDGSLLEPTFGGQSYEQLLSSASGQEIFFRTAQSPITPCTAVGAKVAPFSLVEGETLIITIDGITEIYTVRAENYQNLASVSPFEIIRDFNDQANICAFRTIDGGASVAIFDLSGTAEIMTVTAGDLQKKLGLTTAEIRPIYLYKSSQLLSFKGKTAKLTTSQYPWSLTAAELANVQIVVDGIVQTFSITNADFSPYFKTITTASLQNWVDVLSSKISGVGFSVIGNTLLWSSYQENSSDSYLEILQTQVKPASFNIATSVCTVVTPQNHGLTGSFTVNIKGSSLNNLDGEYTATVTGLNSFTFTSSLVGSGTLFYSDPTSLDVGWIGNGKMWPSPTLLAPLSSTGASKDFSINRFVGEIRLDSKPAVGDKIEVGSNYTRAQITSTKAIAGVFNVSPSITTTGSSRFVVAFDGEYILRSVYFQTGSNILVTPDAGNRVVRFTAYDNLVIDNEMFQDLAVGDYIYLAPDASQASPFDPDLSNNYKIKRKDYGNTWIEFEVSSAELALFVAGNYEVTENMLFAFYSSVTPQVVSFGTATSITVDSAVALINSQIKSGAAEKTSSSQFIFRSNAYQGGSVAVLASIGNAVSVVVKSLAQNIQPHKASIKSSAIDGAFPVYSVVQKTEQAAAKPTRGYLNASYNLTDITGTGLNPTAQASSMITSYPVGYQEYWLSGKLSGYTSRTYNNNATAPFAGFVRTDGVIANIGQFDSLATLNNYRNISLRLNDLPFSVSDKLVVEMDLDDTQKTVAIPMAKRALVQAIDAVAGNGLGQILNFKLSDPDDLYDNDNNNATPSVPRPFFEDYSPFRTFDLKDFRILTKSIGVYPISGADRGLVFRSTSFSAANRMRLSFRYPLSANQAAISVTHKNTLKNNIPETHLVVTMPSGTLSQAITSGTLNIQATQSGSLAELTFLNAAIDPTKFAPGRVLRFAGNHPLAGAYLITSSAAGQAVCLAPSYLNYSTDPFVGLTLQTQSSSNLIKVLHTAHGYTDGDIINTSVVTGANGLSGPQMTVSNAPITIIDANSYTYTGLATASPSVTGSMTVSFAYASRTLTSTPSSAVITVTHTGHNLLNGDKIDVISAPVSGLGGITQSNLQVVNASITYVNANQYSYAALATAPANTASVQLSKSTAVDFSTSNGFNIISVNHPSHNYTSGVVITFSGAAGVAGLIAGQLNISAVVSVVDANTYTYSVSGLANANTSGNTITATYGINTGTLTTTPGTSTVSVSLAGHGLATGASLDILALAGAGGLTAFQLSTTGTVNVLNASQFTYTALAAAPTDTGTASVRRSNEAITASVPNGFNTTFGLVNMTHTNHRFLTGETITFTAASAIGGISAGNLSVSRVVGSPQLTVGNVNSYDLIVNAASPIQTTTGDIIRPVVLSLTQFPLSAYPIDTVGVKKTVKNYADAINAYLPRNAVATAEAIGANTTTNFITEATYISYPNSPFFNATADMEVAYDYHSFAGKLSGYASIFQFPRPSDYLTLAAYNAAIVPNSVRALVQNQENLFPTTSEAGPTPYTPVGEEVYLVPTNTKTVKDWLSFPAISSLSSQSTVAITDSLAKVQISSKLDGFAGAVRITGVTANAATYFAKGVANTVYDAFQLAVGGKGATKINTDFASALPFSKGMLVKVENSVVSEIFRPYRTIPVLDSITNSNTTDIVPFFRPTTEIQFVKTSASQARILFKRFGIGTAQTEPLNVASGNLADPVSVLFANTDINLAPLPSGTIRVTVSDATNTATLAARVGDLMFIRGSTIKSVVSAVWQSGNTVRYTFGAGSGPDGCQIGQAVTFVGFANPAKNNGSYQITAIENTYIEVTNINRVDAVFDETGVVGAVMNFGVSVPAYTSPFAQDQQCRPITEPVTSDLEYIGYPVIHVYDENNILIIAPNITTFGTVTVPNPNTNTQYKSSLVFMPAIYNEKNIKTNTQPGPKYLSKINSGNLEVMVKTLGSGFVSIWASNSAAEATDSMLLEECGVNTDDFVTFGNDFKLANRGTFKLIAHNGRNHMVIYNPNGGTDEILDASNDGATVGTLKWTVGPFTNLKPIKVQDAESVQIGDSLRISSPKILSSWFPDAMIGSFKITAIGFHSASNMLNTSGSFDPTLISPYIDVEVSDAPLAVQTILLGSNVDAVGFTGQNPSFGFRSFIGYTVDPQNPDLANTYLQPDLPSVRASESVGTKVTALFKLGFSEDVERGIDGYKIFSGLIQEAHKTIDGVPQNSVEFPGVRAAGTSVEVLTPLLKSINISLLLQTKDGVDKVLVAEICRSVVAGYVNSLGVGKPVVLSEVIRIVQSLAGVFSVEVAGTLPVAIDFRIAVGDLEKAYILDSSKDIVIS